MKIGLIGTINKDSIKLADGTVRSGWGGILYNMATYDILSENKVSVFPVCNVGADCYHEIMQIIRKFKTVDPQYVAKVDELNNHCYLTYSNQDDKTEILKGGVPRLKYRNLEPLLDCDIIHLNFISGRDVYLKSIQKFRRMFKGRIYIDIHSLTLGIRPNGRRFLSRSDNWRQFAAIADYIQLNRLEAGLLAFNDKTGQSDIMASVEEIRLHMKRKEAGFDDKTVIVTDGKAGCWLAGHVNKKWTIKHIKPENVIDSGNSTGCGDCFGSGYVLGLISGQSHVQSAKLANRTASGRLLNINSRYDVLS